jgi:hypothetical protein
VLLSLTHADRTHRLGFSSAYHDVLPGGEPRYTNINHKYVGGVGRCSRCLPVSSLFAPHMGAAVCSDVLECWAPPVLEVQGGGS